MYPTPAMWDFSRSFPKPLLPPAPEGSKGTTGFGVLQLMADKDRLIADTAKELKAPNPHDIAKKAAQVETELKSEKSRVEALESRIASEKLSSLLEEKKEFKGLSLLLSKTENMTVEAVRAFCDNLREKDPSCVVLLGLVNEGKLNLICSVGRNAQQKGVNAGTLVKTEAQVCGGGGGGRPDSAMAGGKFPEKLPQAFQAVLELLRSFRSNLVTAKPQALPCMAPKSKRHGNRYFAFQRGAVKKLDVFYSPSKYRCGFRHFGCDPDRFCPSFFRNFGGCCGKMTAESRQDQCLRDS